jgi:hypothetical protein
MYLIVEYNNCRKEQDFEIKMVTNNLDYAKKLAFNNAKMTIEDSSFKITTNIQQHHLQPINKIIIEYMVVEVETKNGHSNKPPNELPNEQLKIISTCSAVFAVLELPDLIQMDVPDIDETFICNEYLDLYDLNELNELE